MHAHAQIVPILVCLVGLEHAIDSISKNNDVDANVGDKREEDGVNYRG